MINKLSSLFILAILISLGISFNAYAAVVTNVTASPSSGAISAGQTIAISITFDETVTVTGVPLLVLNTNPLNRRASYSSGSGTNTLVFNYTVAAGDTSNHLDYLTTSSLMLDGGTIATATLTLPVPGTAGSLGANTDLQISTLDSNKFIQVSAGAWHSAAVKADGTVWTWGSNSYGNLGIGSYIIKSSPVQVEGLSNIVSVASGMDRVIALRSDGTVWAWGGNSYGELGDGTTESRSTPVQVSGLTNVVAISASSESLHNIALKSDGTVWGWGYNGQGRIGDGTTTNRTSPVRATTLSGVVSIAAGANHSMFIKSDGTVWTCGSNSGGQLGDGTTTNRTIPVQVSGLTAAVAITAGGAHSLAIKSNRTTWAWGYNSNGQLGDGTTTRRLAPVQVTGMTTTVAITAGDYFSIFLKSDGTLSACGGNNNSQLGDGTTTRRTTCVSVSGLANIVSLAAGAEHSMALKNDGTLWAWGYCGDGELGDGIIPSSRLPIQVSGLTNVAKISAGWTCGMVLKSDNTLWAWGSNSSGQLGDGSTTSKKSPVISAISGVAEIAGAAVHTVILKNDGKVWACGDNSYGQIGDGTTTQRNSPVNISSISPNVNNIIQIAANNANSMALRSDGTVWSWGGNWSGQIGDGTTTQRNSPVQVSGLTGMTAISVGFGHNMALKNDGTVWAWGDNERGQLGDGTTTQRTTPVQVSGLTNVIAIGAGANESYALKADGTVWAWGWDNYGQLGDGTTTNTTSPIQVHGLTNVVSIVSGGCFCYALKADGTVWSWGLNNCGQLGIGTTTNMGIPTQLIGLTNITAVSSGYEHGAALKNDGTVYMWGRNDNYEFGTGVNMYKTTPVQARIDTAPPADATFNVSTTTPTNSTVTVTVNYPTDAVAYKIKIGEGTYTDYTGSVVLSVNAAVYAKSQDETGNWSNEAIYEVTNIDKTAPTVNLYINDGASVTNSTTVTLSVYANDTNGIDGMMISDSSDFSSSSWESFIPTKERTLLVGDGIKQVHIKVKNTLGTESQECIRNITLYTVKPIGTIAINSGNARTNSKEVLLTINESPQTVTTSVYDTVYGNVYSSCSASVAQIMVSNLSSFAGADWESYSAAKNWTLATGDGAKTVYVRLKDIFGNESEVISSDIILYTPSNSSSQGQVILPSDKETVPKDDKKITDTVIKKLDTMTNDEITIAKLQPTIEGEITKVTITNDIAQKVMSSQTNNITSDNGVSKIIIDMQKQDSTRQVEITAPANMFKTIKTKRASKVEMFLGIASLEIPPDTMPLRNADTISIIIKKVDKEKELHEEQQRMVGGSPVYDITAVLKKANGTTENVNNLNREVQVRIPYKLRSGEDPESITVFYMDNKGNLENKIGRYDSSTGTVRFATIHFSKYLIKQNLVSFKDIQNKSEKRKIEMLASKGIVIGRTANMFAPQALITRAEYIAFLIRALRLSKNEGNCVFKDVRKDKWYYNDVASAGRIGLVLGNKKGSFNSEGKVSKKAAMMLAAKAIKIFRMHNQEENIRFKKYLKGDLNKSITRAESIEMIYSIYNQL
jgi:alpha-tubulin suppressor-like RCC1 family protein